MKKTPWHRILDAFSDGKGLRLTADDVRRLGLDEAITMRGQLDEAAWLRGCDDHDTQRCPGNTAR